MPQKAWQYHCHMPPHHGHLPLPHSSHAHLVIQPPLAPLDTTLPAHEEEVPYLALATPCPCDTGMPFAAWPRPTGRRPRPQYTATLDARDLARTPLLPFSTPRDSLSIVDTLPCPTKPRRRRKRRRPPPVLHRDGRQPDRVRHRFVPRWPP